MAYDSSATVVCVQEWNKNGSVLRFDCKEYQKFQFKTVFV